MDIASLYVQCNSLEEKPIYESTNQLFNYLTNTVRREYS